jgi:dienelactone hydrolase
MTASPPLSKPAPDASRSTRAALLESKTRSLILAASNGDFNLASQDFDETMKRALKPSALSTTWNAVQKQAGKLQAIVSVAPSKSGGHLSDEATCAFEHANLIVRVTYNDDDTIGGLHILPADSAAAAWEAPTYAKPATFEERSVTVGITPALPGTLTVPRGVASAPIVILVHGSGPNDADESVGGVKVFKDLAWGLASRGIAVLRYVKRTRQDPSGVVTSKEEVLDDVHTAIELAKNTAGIDKGRVFILGHSIGGYLAPRIVRDNPGLAGAIILAGSTRPLQDSVIDQLTYLSSLDGAAGGGAALASMLDEARKSKRAIEAPGLKADDDVHLLGTTVKGAYFLDLRGYDPAKMAAEVDCPLLVLQGERDYQVTMKDFGGWKATLASRANASLKTYPSLNHLFASGEGAPSPSEYAKPAHVDGAVVEDVAAWVMKH